MAEDTEIRKSFWQDNYFTLVPGESQNTEIPFPARLINGKNLKILIYGLNVSRIDLPVRVK